MAEDRRQAISEKQKLTISILLALVALVSITAASVAWFTIADFTKVYSMNMEITSGTNLRFDLDPHETFEEYVKNLKFTQIADRIKANWGYDMKETPLEPVTTEDYINFSIKDGTIKQSDSGAYLEFTLHFMATSDMVVHLTSASSDGGKDGTAITSSNSQLPQAMRISFTADNKTYVYHPGMGDQAEEKKSVKNFGLASGNEMVLNDNNAMFQLKADVNKPVLVHIWLEGTDPACTDALRNADYQIRMRFVGTDSDNNILDGEHSRQ